SSEVAVTGLWRFVWRSLATEGQRRYPSPLSFPPGFFWRVSKTGGCRFDSCRACLSTAREDLVRAISTARDQAKKLLTALEQQSHPETSRSSSLYLALVSIRKRLTKDEQSPSAVVAELEQLVTLCAGKLARIKPDLEDALRIARGAA